MAKVKYKIVENGLGQFRDYYKIGLFDEWNKIGYGYCKDLESSAETIKFHKANWEKGWIGIKEESDRIKQENQLNYMRNKVVKVYWVK